MEQFETKKIELKLIEPNTGQIVGLPTNPRQWTRDEMDKLKASIIETPELLQARGLVVYPFDGKYIIMGGNMRYNAVKELNMISVPCIVLPEDMPVEKLKEIVIKDNGSFGEWDWDELANQWDEVNLADWGVPTSFIKDDDNVEIGDFFEQSQNQLTKEKKIVISVIIPQEESDLYEDVLNRIKETISIYPNISIE